METITPKHTNDRLQGTLDLLILKSLASRGAMHGYGITVHIQSIAGDCLRVEEGSLYPALHRMAHEGWIAAEWGASENNRRARYYTLTAAGRKQLGLELTQFERTIAAIGRCYRVRRRTPWRLFFAFCEG